MSLLHKWIPFVLLLDGAVGTGTETEMGIIKYTNAGFYKLEPSDYKYSDKITIEMWGGGASGGCSNAGEGRCSHSNAGGSSAYVKATFNPDNLILFISVGRGGIAPMCQTGEYKNGDRGTSSFLYSFDGQRHEPKLDVVVGGGYASLLKVVKVFKTTGAEVISKHEEQTLNNNAISTLCPTNFETCLCNQGGNSHRGGYGGTANIGCTRSNFSDPEINGWTPGGGGGSSPCRGSNNLINAGGNGGNGTVIIYYEISLWRKILSYFYYKSSLLRL